MYWNSLIKIAGITLAVSLSSGCSTKTEAPVVHNIYKNVTYDANTRVDGYFDDQFVIFKNLFPDFTVSRVSKHEIKIIVPSDYGYQTGSWAMNRDLRNSISEMARTLNDYKESSIWIYGHTDTVGNLKENLTLSQNRANAVRDVLLESHVDIPRIKTVAEAFEMPRCDNASKLGKDCNRRVEISIKDVAI